MSQKDIVLSGIRPTGNLHLGNYFGAVKNFIKMQHDTNAYFFIADYHSLTTHPTPENLHANVKQVLAEYLACGLDPEKSTIYVQSDLPFRPRKIDHICSERFAGNRRAVFAIEYECLFRRVGKNHFL